MATLAPGRRTAAALPMWSAALTDHVAALAVSPGGSLVAAGSLGGDSIVLDSRDGATVAELSEHPLGVLSIGGSPGGGRLAAGGQDGRVTLWDRSGRTVESFDMPGWVVQVA